MYQPNLNSVWLATAVLCASALVALSSPYTAMANTFDEVVVTGTRTQKLLQDSPVRVDVLDAEVVKMVSMTTVAEAMHLIPGLVLKANQKSGTTVQMQGFDGDRILVLVDGLPVITPVGSSADVEQISALNVDRIEVIRGAASVLYGSSAMGGVINIITDDAQGGGGQIATRIGEYHDALPGAELSHQVNVTGRYSKSDFRSSISAQSLRDSGFDFNPDSVVQDAGALKKSFLSAELGMGWQSLIARYKGHAFNEEKRRVVSEFTAGSKLHYQSTVKQSQHNLLLTSQHNPWQLSYRHDRFNELSGQDTGRREADIVNQHVDLQSTLAGLGGAWTIGGGYYSEQLDQINLATGEAEVDDKQRDGMAVFAQSDITLGRWEFIVGARHQHDSAFGGHNSFRSSLRYATKNSDNSNAFIWRASIGESYRVPNLKELHYQFDHSNLGYKVLGNPTLNPETAIGVSSDVEWRGLHAGWTIKTQLGAHYTVARDFIISEPQSLDQSNVLISSYINIQRARTQGIDLSSQFSKQSVFIQASYSYLDARDRETHGRLPDRPYHQLKLHYKQSVPPIFILPSFRFLLSAVYEADEAFDREEMPDEIANHHLTLNLNIESDISSDIRWKLGVDNLLNQHRKADLREYQFDSRAVDNRFIYTGFTLTF